MHSPVGALLQTVFLSICEVFIVAFAGYILARYGALDRRTQRQLNRLNIALFTPSLVFSKVAFTLSPAKFKELWIVPLFFVVLSFVSAAVAWGMGHLFRLKPSQRNFAIAASMFMNSNSLPIALLQSLVVSVPGLNWGEDDTTASKIGRALTYLTLCSTLGMVFRWSIGVRLLAAADPAEEAQEDPVDITEATPLLTPDSSADGSELTPEIPAISIQPSTPLDQPPPRKSTTPYIHTFPSTPIGSHLVLPVNKNLPQAEYAPSESDASDDDSDILSMGNRRALQARKRGFAYKTWSACKRGWAKFSAFMTAPLYASIISIAVALWPDLQHTLDVHLTPVKGAVTQLGNCSIPITLVVLGAYFFTPSEPKNVDTDLDTSPRHQPSTWWQRTRSMLSLHSFRTSREEKRRAPKGETRTVIVAIASRMIVVPALFLPLIAIGALRDVPPVFEDPVFILSLVLLLGSPPALTLSQMTQAVAGDAFERLISKTIFWSYCVFTPPLTVVLALVSMIIAKM